MQVTVNCTLCSVETISQTNSQHILIYFLLLPPKCMFSPLAGAVCKLLKSELRQLMKAYLVGKKRPRVPPLSGRHGWLRTAAAEGHRATCFPALAAARAHGQPRQCKDGSGEALASHPPCARASMDGRHPRFRWTTVRF